jgi:hypothetical protein
VPWPCISILTTKASQYVTDEARPCSEIDTREAEDRRDQHC